MFIVYVPFVNLKYSVSGTKPQVISTIVRPDVQMELYVMAVGAYGISLGEHATPLGGLCHVFQVSGQLEWMLGAREPRHLAWSRIRFV